MIATEVLKKIVPWGYQEECLTSIEAAENAGKKTALVIMAGGLGKTIIAGLHVQKRFKRNPKARCLFLCHMNDTLEQAEDRFKRVMGSDLSCGYYMGDRKTAHGARVVFATFQTMTDHLEEFNTHEFDIIVVDETHHVMAETFKAVVDYFIPNFLLGITATPERGDELDICEIYGKPVYTLHLVDALARGLLCPIDYRLMTDEISRLETIETEHGHLSINRLNRLIFIPKRDEEIARLIIEEIAKLTNPRVMIFCPSVTHAEQMAELIPGSVPIHSDIPKSERKVRLELFRQGMFKVAVTVDMFNEAIDVPETNLLVFLRNTDSPAVFFQQLCRCTRLCDGKDKAIVLDFVGNCERVAQIYQIWKDVKEKREYDLVEDNWRQKRDRIEPFNLNIETDDFQKKVIPLLDLIGRFTATFYLTWQEASEKAIALGFTSSTKYKQSYSKDRRLPYNPSNYYVGFPGWKDFLDKESNCRMLAFYATWNEAMLAIQKIGIKTSTEYREKYKLDSRLPSSLANTYPDYPGDVVFWEHTCKKYLTWKKASDATKNLGISTAREYLKRHKEDIMLPHNPNLYYADFPGWLKFLGKKKKSFYVRWQIASKALQKIGITNSSDYSKMRNLDPKLHSQPHIFYSDFPGWGVYLNNGLYSTWEEASKAAVKLEIPNEEKYIKGKMFKGDKKLPSNPMVHYQNFPGWKIFLGRDFYLTWQEAADATKKLGIKDYESYLKKYKKDLRLPSNPQSHYQDYPGLREFFGIAYYSTWKEASEAVKKLVPRPTTMDEYKKVYKQDIRLVVHPHAFYSDFPGIQIYLGTNIYPTWQEASEAAKKLGIKSNSQYQKNYKQDLRLPGLPLNQWYPDFPGSRKFFATDFYSTWQEASVAVKKLGIKNYQEYLERYSEDSRLPGGLHNVYSGFPGRTAFFS